MGDEYAIKCHDLAKELINEFRVVEHVARRHREDEDRIREYAKYYQQAYELFYLLGQRQAGK